MRECVGGPNNLDYIVALDVVEHVQDLLTRLQKIREILKPGGQLRLAVADRRYSFDYLQQESRLGDLLDAFLRGARSPLQITILDHIGNTRNVTVVKAWSEDIVESELQPVVSPLSYKIESAPQKMRSNISIITMFIAGSSRPFPSLNVKDNSPHMFLD